MSLFKPFSLAFAVTFFCCAGQASARDQIKIVGSSTVYPFVSTAAEQFGEAGEFKTPIVESTGTGGGFKLFCSGVGEDKPDISNASRAILDSEREQCQKNGVTDIAEIKIGYDGIVIANKKGAAAFALTRKNIFMALARELPDGKGAFVPNPYKSWKQIDAGLPDQPIVVYGPPPTSGTRDAFVELVMEPGCEQFAEFKQKYADEKARKNACHMLREDGGYVDSGEDDNIIVQKLASDNKALGILGYSYFEENAAKIQASAVDGVMPTSQSIEAGKYLVSRSLYVYVKKQHMGKIPGLAEFIRELTGENALGAEGYMTAKGLLPLHDDERKAMQETVKKLVAK